MEVRQIEPMLARTLPQDKLDEMMMRKDVVAEEKLDGERNLLHIMPDGSARITSRRISKKTGKFHDKTEHVPHLTRPGTWPKELAGTVIDGEMMHPDGFKRTASIFRSLPERAVKLQSEFGNVEFCVFDVLFDRGQSLMEKSWEYRRKWLETVFSPDVVWPKEMYLSKVVIDDKEYFLEEIWERGGEGIILKPMGSLYVPGGRNDWVKVKSIMTIDVVVIGFVGADMEYTGKYAETWEYWAVREGDGWKKCRLKEAQYYRSMGREVKPVNSSWWKGWLSAFKFGQYVRKARWHELGEPPYYATFRDEKGVEWFLIEVGQTGPGDEEAIVDMTERRDWYLVQVAELKVYGRFEDTGRLRHPVFMRWRSNKNPEDCRWE